MTIEVFSGDTLDDLLHDVYEALLVRGTAVRASRGETIELSATALELTNPRARLSRSESRGIVISCLGEMCWYLNGDDRLDTINYYLSAYDEEAVEGKVLGAYGPRLFGPPPNDQVKTLLGLLKQRPSSRRAVLQIFGAEDLRRTEGDVPCTCTLQFLARDGALDLIANMRSNDAVTGLVHDVFCFTMLQELVARSLGLEMGRYYHMVGSLHYYPNRKIDKTTDREKVRRFLDEGYQSTKYPMPAMPPGDPWQDIEDFLRMETDIRTGNTITGDRYASLPGYWRDLVVLLEAYRARRVRRIERLKTLRADLANDVYMPFLVAQLARLELAMGGDISA